MIIMADKNKITDHITQQGVRSLRIGRPVLQKATSSAESLISNAPGTGVSQTSILSKKCENGSKKKTKSVVFCEPLTLPSPTNPCKPPIIHQQLHDIHSESNSSSPIPSESDFHLYQVKPCKTDEKVLLADELRAPIASPESFKIRDSFVDGGKSKGNQSPEKKSTRRNIDISNPVLNSEIDLKMNLIPINSPCLTAEFSKRSSEAKLMSRTTDDFDSPRRRNNSKTRPVSIAIFSPVRPKSPPPPCPNTKDLSNADLLREDSDYQSDLLQEILLEADKKVEFKTGETHLCSSIITPSKKRNSPSSQPHTWL